MKILTIILTFALSLISAQAQEEKAGADHKIQLVSSLKAWKKASAKSKGNYSYQVTTSSMMGYRTVTTITVENNKVVNRTFEEFYPADMPKPENLKNYKEDVKTLGTHEHGATAHTMEELYDQAIQIAKKDLAPHEQLYFKLDKNGILQCCFIINTRIMDDAPSNGVNIANLKM